MPFQVMSATLTLSGKISTTVKIAGATLVGAWVPLVTSGDMYVQGSWDTTSANFFRIQNAAGSGDFTLGVGVGSKAYWLNEPVTAFPYIRFESAVNQASTFALKVVAKF